jgi:uncharacterized damage-inducible protein DinB
MRIAKWCVAGFCLALLVMPLRAQEKQAAPGGFRGEFLGQVDDVEKKLVSLAEAVPQEKYSWRPAEGVRSVSEVYMHVAGSNYFFLSFIGVKPPAMERGLEKSVTEKAKVVQFIKDAFAFAKTSVGNVKDADLDKEATMFGSKTTVRNVLFTLALHMHEHLGQSVAYARTCGVVPPWSMPEKGSK